MQRQRKMRPVAAPSGPAASGRLAPDLDLLMVQLAKSLRVAVIYGGDKSVTGAVLRETHNPRSWKSYESVARDLAATLERLGFGSVAVIPDDRHLMARLKAHKTNLAWINSGGVQGRNAISHTPALLEMLGIPYVGHDPLTAALLDSKHHFKRQLQAIGVPTAPFLVWHPDDARQAPVTDRRLKARFTGWPHGFVVKPVTGRASLHVHYVERASALPQVVRKVFEATQNSVLVEAFLPGREYCIAVSGSVIAQGGKLRQLPGPFAFSAIERRLEQDEPIFTSMDVKPITTSRTRALDPKHDADTIEKLETMARQVYAATPLQTLVRLDVRADQKGDLFVLEANPKPDLAAPRQTATSLVCAGLGRYGMSYDDLVLSILADRLAALFQNREQSVAAFFKQFQYKTVRTRR